MGSCCNEKSGGTRKGFCPFSLVLFGASMVMYMVHLNETKKTKKSTSTDTKKLPSCQVVFVVGAPGTGKGTQCELLVKRTQRQWCHLSAGDLLRAERQRIADAKAKGESVEGSLGETIENCINAGKLVPSDITVKLLEQGMTAAYQDKGVTQFLLDGFPRGQDNITAWDNLMGDQHQILCVLNYDAPEEVLVGRLLERGKSSGRSDDNMDVIRKRFKTHVEAAKPVLKKYGDSGLLHSINADQSKEDVYQQTSKIVLAKSCLVETKDN